MSVGVENKMSTIAIKKERHDGIRCTEGERKMHSSEGRGGCTSGYISNGNKIIFWSNIFTPMSVTELFTTAEVWNQPKSLLTDEWRT